MAKSRNQKLKLAVLRRILLENTDEQHPLSMKQIIARLEANGIAAERKSVYDDFETLRSLGTDVKVVRGKTTGYYVAQRDFELSELKLLIDAVRASKFISVSSGNRLIKKLSSLACIHNRPSLNREVFVSNRSSNTSGDIFVIVDRIHEAIEKDRALKFKYFLRNARKQKEYRRNGDFYRVSPWSLVFDDGNYYLIAFDNQKKEIRHFRVDKMEEISITDSPREGKEDFKQFDINSYSHSAFGMFGGKPERVTISCNNRLANVMLDRFGKDSPILNFGDKFRITVSVIPSPVFLGWIIGFGGEAEIVSPEYLAEEIKKLKNTL